MSSTRPQSLQPPYRLLTRRLSILAGWWSRIQPSVEGDPKSGEVTLGQILNGPWQEQLSTQGQEAVWNVKRQIWSELYASVPGEMGKQWATLKPLSESDTNVVREQLFPPSPEDSED